MCACGNVQKYETSACRFWFGQHQNDMAILGVHKVLPGPVPGMVPVGRHGQAWCPIVPSVAHDLPEDLLLVSDVLHTPVQLPLLA